MQTTHIYWKFSMIHFVVVVQLTSQTHSVENRTTVCTVKQNTPSLFTYTHCCESAPRQFTVVIHMCIYAELVARSMCISVYVAVCMFVCKRVNVRMAPVRITISLTSFDLKTGDSNVVFTKNLHTYVLMSCLLYSVFYISFVIPT